MANKDPNRVWLFDFALEKESGDHIEQKYADELMDVIVQWAEGNKCQIGGGYRRPTEDDYGEFPLK